MDHWSRLKMLILSEDYKGIHRTVWEDFAVVTDQARNRFRIDSACSLPEAKALLDEIKTSYNVESYINSTNITILSSLIFIFNLN